MKIAKALIEDFRQIDRLELDFTGADGKARDLCFITGPNSCGKTTVLDAIAAALGPTTEFHSTRPGFTLTKGSIVRKGADFSKVTLRLQFTDDEFVATRELFSHASDETVVPDVREVTLTWRYPDPDHRSSFGFADTDPETGWTLLKGRVRVAKLLPSGKVTWDWFKRVGGIFTFDQQRTGQGKTIRQDLWNISQAASVDSDETMPSMKRAMDPRTMLLQLALKAQKPPPDLPNLHEFKTIQEHFARLSAPRQILGAVRDEFDTPDLRFSDGMNEYGYDGVSAGEEMLLLFLIRLASEHVHRSILLIDEVELHQGRGLQEALLTQLPKFGESNQVIATTQSPILLDTAPAGAVISMGGKSAA
jgi:predicted ATPase